MHIPDRLQERRLLHDVVRAPRPRRDRPNIRLEDIAFVGELPACREITGARHIGHAEQPARLDLSTHVEAWPPRPARDI